MLRVDSGIMTRFGKELLVTYGTKPEVAEEVVEHLIENSLRGVEGHGVNRYPEYAAQLEKGTIKGNVEATVSELEPGVFKVDGCGGFGITAMNKATSAIKTSLTNRAIAAACVIGVGHTGRIGAYTENLASGYVFASIFGGGGHKKFKSTAPFGGRRGVMGTNPVAFALPGRGDIPVSADFSTSSTAGGKLRLARTMGSQLPPNQIIDANGRPTSSPEDYFAGGAILPSAGSKGYGLGVICEMLGYALLGQPHEFNWVILALRLGAFSIPEEYASRAKDFLSEISACPPMEGFDAVKYPGEIEMVRRSQNLAMGIPIHENVVESIAAAARRRGLNLPSQLMIKR